MKASTKAAAAMSAPSMGRTVRGRAHDANASAASTSTPATVATMPYPAASVAVVFPCTHIVRPPKNANRSRVAQPNAVRRSTVSASGRAPPERTFYFPSSGRNHKPSRTRAQAVPDSATTTVNSVPGDGAKPMNRPGPANSRVRVSRVISSQVRAVSAAATAMAKAATKAEKADRKTCGRREPPYSNAAIVTMPANVPTCCHPQPWIICPPPLSVWVVLAWNHDDSSTTPQRRVAIHTRGSITFTIHSPTPGVVRASSHGPAPTRSPGPQWTRR